MALTVDALVRIAIASGGLIIDCQGYNADGLVRIAIAAKEKGKVILTNTSGFSVDALVRIAIAGGGNVIIDTRK